MQFIADRKDDNAVLVEAVETIMAILDANPTFRQVKSLKVSISYYFLYDPEFSITAQL